MALAAISLALGWRNRQSWLFAAALIVHGLWSVGVAVGGPAVALPVLHTAHYAVWSIFFAGLLPQGKGGKPAILVIAATMVLLGRIGLIALGGPTTLPSVRLSLVIDLTAIIIVLVGLVGVFQAAGEEKRWSLKFLCFPLGAVFGYDLFLYTQSLAVAVPGPPYFAMRGPLTAAILPFVYIAAYRQKLWQEQFFVSRQAALYSITLIGVGVYFLIVAAVALAIEQLAGEEVSGELAVPLQTGLLFVAVLLLLFLLSSGTGRAKIKLFIAHHFYPRKYDYAHEWRTFMHTLALEEQSTSLETRTIRACADPLEVPGGALWLLENRQPQLQATWNYRVPPTPVQDVDSDVFRDSEGNIRCLYGDRLAQSPFAPDPAAWAVIPLPDKRDPVGFVVLGRPRARNSIDREDEELILLVARQCTSFLMENRAAVALEQNRQFARFNRRYAFVAHDIKNIVSQLSVLLRNYERHADNPDFQRDMRETIGHTVERLQSLIGRLSRLADGDSGFEEAETVGVFHEIERELASLTEAGQQNVVLSAGEGARAASVHLSRERFLAVVGHLLANAREAAGENGHVAIRVDLSGHDVIIDISDDGPGMSAEFVRDHLFTPFRSSKSSGFGVGAFQCREFAREHGGDLEVISSQGSGTTMRLRLPVAAVEEQPAAQS